MSMSTGYSNVSTMVHLHRASTPGLVTSQTKQGLSSALAPWEGVWGPGGPKHGAGRKRESIKFAQAGGGADPFRSPAIS